MYPRPSQLDKVDQFKVLHAKGLPNSRIAHELNISAPTITRWIRDHGLIRNLFPKSISKPREPAKPRGPRPSCISETKARQAIEWYQNGISQNEVSRRLGIHANRFTTLMREYGVSVRGRFKHAIRSDYFDRIDSFYKAYFLGWLAADGHVRPTRDRRDGKDDARTGRISLSIQARDCYIVEALRVEIGFSGTVKRVHKGGNRQDQCRLNFCDQHMGQTLLKYGLTPHKSASFQFPDIPEEWISAFILGYFDGDGSVSWGRYTDKGYTAIRQRFDIIGSPSFVDRLAKILIDHGVKVGISEEKRKSFLLKYVRGSSRESMLAFYRLVYTDAPLYLKRKRDKFDEIFKELGITP